MLRVNTFESGICSVYLFYATGGFMSGYIPVFVYKDGRRMVWNKPNSVLIDPKERVYESFDDSGKFIGQEKPLIHDSVDADITYHMEREILNTDSYVYLYSGYQPTLRWRINGRGYINIPIDCEFPFYDHVYNVIVAPDYIKTTAHYPSNPSRDQEWLVTFDLDNLKSTTVITFSDGRKPQTNVESAVFYMNNFDLHTGSSEGIQLLYGKAIEEIAQFGEHARELYPPEAHWRASKDATYGNQVYDINMVEGILNLGIDDLIPVKASMRSINYLDDLLKGNWAVKALKSTQIAATMFLHQKYIVNNNVRDISTLLGVDYDVGVLLDRAATSLEDDGVEFDEYNHQIGTIAKKIVYGDQYRSSTYGADTNKLSIPFVHGQVVLHTNAKLVASPGIMADISAVSIITDDIGLKFSASRAVEAVPFEFIANWFLPIEQTINDIEFNSSHLNALYTVHSLTLSDKLVVIVQGEDLSTYFGLSHCTGSIKMVLYNRTVDDVFPETVLSFSSDSGGISMNRILQGGALLISK